MMRVFVSGVAIAMLAMCPAAWSRTDTKVESSKPVVSDDGKRTVVIDRLTPVIDGEPERFSGRMLVRVTSADGSAAKQRYIEASQVRVVQPPVWLDGSRICAFVYNVAKSSNGIVYFEPDTNRALQVEFVMPSRRMAASGKVEQELTSLEVTEFAKESLTVRNIPWQGGSAFPLVLSPLPEFHGRPYDLAFYNELNASLTAYKSWLNQNGVKQLEPEQASEAFSPADDALSILACGEDKSFLAVVPLVGGSATTVMPQVKLAELPDVELSCAQHAAGGNDYAPMSDIRYLTAWKNGGTVQVMRESYNSESDAAETSAVAQLDVKSKGAKLELATSGTLSASQ